ncbi:MAG: pitrilysin family protein [Pseudomonadota bacterium]|nr:MAG: peptidase M16 [Pseudomonadota bacterium]
MRRIASLFLTFGALGVATASPAPTVPGREAVRSLTLANGMKVIVWPDRDIPNIALYNWVRVGSRNEAPGITGLAHFFEHMMFNGTTRRAPGEFDRLMEAQGGANNAFTSDDVTVYQDWFPRSALELVFDLESDRIANLAFVPEVIESERGVVFSERRLRVDDNNHGILSEQVQATAFVAHPYQFPTIGWPSDIQSWTLEDLQRFYRTYYAPNNQTMVLAGDFEPEEVFALARKYFEPIPRQAPPEEVRTREPEQLGERRVVVRRPAQTPLLQYAYKAPAANDPRAPAASLLMSILVEGDASRLHRLLVEERKLAIEVSGYWHEGFDPGLFWLYLTLPEGSDPEHVQSVLDAELERITREGVTAAELQRAKNLTLASFWKQLATIDGKARLLGEFEVFHGDWRKLFDAPAQYEAVTRDEILAVARDILDRRRRTVGVLLPQEEVEVEAEEVTACACS